MLLVDTELCA